MASEWAKPFYGSVNWQKCRSGFISYKRGLCERCLSIGVITPGTQVHHKIHLTPENITDPKIALDWNNLELLCDECHRQEHTGNKRYSVDEHGRVLAKSAPR